MRAAATVTRYPAACVAAWLAFGVAACGSEAPPSGGDAPATAAPAATVCQAPNRPAGVRFGANVNTLFWEAHYGDTRLLATVRALGQPVVRLPGGTESDYFDWALGRPVELCRYGGCRPWDDAQLTPPALYQRFGAFRNSTAAGFADFARAVDGTPLLVANTMTASVEDNVRWISAVAEAGSLPTLIELGNEPYFGQAEGTDNTARLYPTAASHVAFAQRLAAALRGRTPAPRLAYPMFVPRIDAGTGQPTAGHDARMLSWNERALAAGIAGDVEAFALHLYPRLPGRGGASDAAYLRALARFAEAYWLGTRQTAQWAQLPADRRLWITELNASFTDAPELVGTWVHALVQAQLMVLMLQDPRVELLLQHMLTGNAQWQAVVHPGRPPDIAPAPGFTPYALTASGEALAALSAHLGGSSCVEAIPTTAAGAVGIVARSPAGVRAVVVNASADPVPVDISTLGLTRATVVQRSASPLGRPAAGASVVVATSLAAAGTGPVSVAPYTLATFGSR